jgi:hypothetical protein
MRLYYQQGQSFVLTMIFLLILSLSMVFVFNITMMLDERLTAKSLADHAAYSTANQQAKLLNLNAYMNRAKVANQLAISQAVSMGSWNKMIQKLGENVGMIPFPPLVILARGVGFTGQIFAESAGVYVGVGAAATLALDLEQDALNAAAFTILRTPNLVLSQSENADRFQGLLLPISSSRNFINQDFLKRYSGNERTRMREVVLNSIDPYTKARRSKDECNILMPCPMKPIKGSVLKKRGGTELVGFDQWKGVDTWSLHESYWRWSNSKRKLIKKSKEIAIGYGSAMASTNTADQDSRNSFIYGGSTRTNGTGSQWSSGSRPTWDSRDGMVYPSVGIPNYYDLSEAELVKSEPKFLIAISIKKKTKDLNTTGQASNLDVSGALTLSDGLGRSGLTAVSASEVYFERPERFALNKGLKEKASLFNPYWRVRLIEPNTANLAEAYSAASLSP